MRPVTSHAPTPEKPPHRALPALPHKFGPYKDQGDMPADAGWPVAIKSAYPAPSRCAYGKRRKKIVPLAVIVRGGFT